MREVTPEDLDFLEMTPEELAELRRWAAERARRGRWVGGDAFARLRPDAVGRADTELKTLDDLRRIREDRVIARAETGLLAFAGSAALTAAALWLWWRRYKSAPMPTHDLGLDVLGRGY